MEANWKDMTIAELKQLAEQGNARAMAELGVRYIFGNVREYDKEQGRYWLERAAACGNDLGQYGMGLICESPKERAEWYKKAAVQGNKAAMLDLAQCYRSGDGVEKNDEAARKLYEELAAQGNSYAAYVMKKFYTSGGSGK